MEKYSRTKITKAIKTFLILILIFKGSNIYPQSKANFRNQISNLKSTIIDKDRKISNLSEEKKDLEVTIDIYKDTTSHLLQSLKNTEAKINILKDSIHSLKTIAASETELPAYKQEFLNKLQKIGQWAYVYIVMPIVSLLLFIILFTYAYQNIFGENKSADRSVQFRRIVSWLFPFFLSSYTVFVYYIGEFKFDYSNTGFIYPGDIFFLVGLFLGFLFFAAIARISFEAEIQVILVTFLSSLILFAVLTAFVLIQSLPIINIIYGFIIGAILYVFFFGFDKISMIFPKRRKKTE